MRKKENGKGENMGKYNKVFFFSLVLKLCHSADTQMIIRGYEEHHYTHKFDNLNETNLS